MLTVTKLRRKPAHFHGFTGLSIAEFDQLLSELTPVYAAAQHQRQHQPDRKRCPGAGHPFALELPERVRMGLIYLRLYVSQSLLSFLFDLDQSNVCREINHRLLPVLLSVLPVPLRDAPLRACAQEEDKDKPPSKEGKKARRINTLSELLAAHPELEEVLLDATEQPIPQPKDKQKRKLCYSGKQHTHTLKTQIVASKKLILHVFGGLPGCLNDQMLLGASGVLEQMPSGMRVRLDKGYEGRDKRHPHLEVMQPVRGQRGHKVTALGRAYNHLLSVLRIPVEHHFARLQLYRILKEIFRGRFSQHEDLFCVVSGLENFKATGSFSLA